MQQRVGLARALAAETPILLMDEAFSALDPLIRREMQDQLVELQASLGKTIVFITHDLNEAMYVGDRIAVMRSGRIVQIGSAEQILTEPANDYVAKFTAEVDRTRVLTAASVLQPAQVTLPVTAGPQEAIIAMRHHQTDRAWSPTTADCWAISPTTTSPPCPTTRRICGHSCAPTRWSGSTLRPDRGIVRSVSTIRGPAGGDRRRRPVARGDPADQPAGCARPA